MKTKMRIFDIQVFLRALIVLVASAAIGLLIASPLRNQLDALYRTTGDEMWFDIFYFVSHNRWLFAVAGCLLSLLLLSGWILRPAFNRFAVFVHKSINMEGTTEKTIRLPKELKQLEDELNNINKEIRLWKYAAKEAEARKDDLVVYIAHDIRTPLTSVLGYLELLDETPDLAPRQRDKFVSVALRKARRMQALVEELFEITRYNISQLELEKQEINAGVLLNQLIEELEGEVQQKKITVKVQTENTKIFADPDKLARALDNILHNAVYYTPKGGAITARADMTETGMARIQIANTGSEISQEKLNRFFEKFYRGDAARQSGSGGSGLGLAIAKNIIEAHGGTITAGCQNKITVFTVQIPV